jgi:preprotein translocase subunit SecG
MPEWWTYQLADAQIFSARAYDRLVERCMREAWPAQPVVVALGLVVLVLLWRRPGFGARALAIGSALACASVAAWWLPQCYAELHWASGWMAGGFALQALLLAVASTSPGALRRATSATGRGLAMALFAVALLVIPWLSMPEGGSLWRAEFVGLMPTPAIAACLAVVPLATLRWRLLLLPLPLAGTVLESVTSASVGRHQWMLLPLEVMVLAAMLAAWRWREAAVH